MADLGGKWGQLPPFTMKTKLWRPLFGKKSAPYPDPNALFSMFRFECGETLKLRRYSEEKPENFIERSPKSFARLRRAHFSFSFWRPLSKLPPLQPRAGSAPAQDMMIHVSVIIVRKENQGNLDRCFHICLLAFEKAFL